MASTPLQIVSNQKNSDLNCLISPQSASRNRLLKYGSAGKNILAQSPNLPESNEDEVQKARQRRHSRNFSGVISLSDQGDGTAKWSKDKLLQHYSECMKLSQENKINHKNAFDLQLIEHMGEMIRQDGSLNFRVAGGTIFAGAKIYASRVDAIHSEIYRVLSSLSSGDKDENTPNEENNNEDQEKRMKRRKKHSKILETTESNLRIPLNNVFAAGESRNRLQNRAIDAASCTTLNLNHLSMDKDKFILQHHYDTTAKHIEEVNSKASRYQNLPLNQILKSSSSKISDFFHEVNFDENELELADNMADSDLSSLDNDIPDNEDFPSADLAPGNLSDDADNGESEDPVFDSHPENLSKAKVPDVPSAIEVAHLVAIAPPAEYSYFKPNVLSVIDGPGHWMRNKRLRPTATKSAPLQEGDEPSSEKPQPKKRKIVDENRDIRKNSQVVLDKKLQPQKISKAKRESLRKNMKDNLLLEYVDKAAESILRARELKIILKPLTAGLLRRAGVTLAEGYDTANFNYVDDQYCPQSTADDCDETGQDLFTDNTECFFPDFSQTIVTSSDCSRDNEAANDYNALLEGDHLLEQPRKLEKVQIHFAKRAKRIDVRKLKSVMWNLIEPEEEDDGSISGEKAADKSADESDLTATDKSPSSSSKDPQLFSQLYSHLPGKVSKNMMENLSVPLAFTCLLHLANEKQLKIEGMSTLSDIRISLGL